MSVPTPVKQQIKEAREALARKGLPQPLAPRRVRVDNVEHWKVGARGIPVNIDSTLEGMWVLNMEWLFTPVPLGGLEIVQSSVGLYVQGARGLGAGEACLVRYDVDNGATGTSLSPLGPHLNVAQPGRLRDKIHYPIPGVENGQWQVSKILDVLLSDRLAHDLATHLGGARRRRRR
jgi:hypothetical protein